MRSVNEWMTGWRMGGYLTCLWPLSNLIMIIFSSITFMLALQFPMHIWVFIWFHISPVEKVIIESSALFSGRETEGPKCHVPWTRLNLYRVRTPEHGASVLFSRLRLPTSRALTHQRGLISCRQRWWQVQFYSLALLFDSLMSWS